MSKKNRKPPEGEISLTPEEHVNGLPTLESVLESAGMRLLGVSETPPEAIDATELQIPAQIMTLVKAEDQQIANHRARLDAFLEVGLRMLSVDLERYHPSVNLDNGTVTLTERAQITRP